MASKMPNAYFVIYFSTWEVTDSTAPLIVANMF